MSVNAPLFALIVKLEDLLAVLTSAAAFVLLGLFLFGVAFILVVKLAPFSVQKEIEDDQNTALAIIIGSIIIGIAIIIGAAIQG